MTLEPLLYIGAGAPKLRLPSEGGTDVIGEGMDVRRPGKCHDFVEIDRRHVPSPLRGTQVYEP